MECETFKIETVALGVETGGGVGIGRVKFLGNASGICEKDGVVEVDVCRWQGTAFAVQFQAVLAAHQVIEFLAGDFVFPQGKVIAELDLHFGAVLGVCGTQVGSEGGYLATSANFDKVACLGVFGQDVIGNIAAAAAGRIAGA